MKPLILIDFLRVSGFFTFYRSLIQLHSHLDKVAKSVRKEDAPINYALGDKAEMLKTLQNNIELVLKEEEENSTESIDARLRELQQELLKRANFNKSYDDLANEIDRLRKEKQNAAVDKADREGVKNVLLI